MDNLHAIRRGAFLTDVTESVKSIVKMVQEAGKAGKVTIEIGIKPVSKNDDQLQVTDTIRLTPPKPDSNTTILWATEDGELTRSDPNAPQSAPLREVSA